MAEERKLALAAAQAKKKAATKKNKKEEPKDEPPAEEVKARSTPKLVASGEEEDSEEEDYDLFLADQFQKALCQKFVRPFTVGPITFDHLSGEVFDYDKQRQVVIKQLEAASSVKENNIFVHGFKVAVKERQLKRGTSLLKHARFLQNL